MANKAKTTKKASKKTVAKAKKPATWKPKPVEGTGWPAFRYPLPL